MLTLIDYGVGNLGSITNMFKKIGYPIQIAATVETLKSATKIILPGVGAFDHGMTALEQSGMMDLLHHKVLNEHCFVLGICLGAQMLGLKSEEGKKSGLGWIEMEVIRFQIADHYRIPHMGWNRVRATQENPLIACSAEELRFYFAHSYHMQCDKDWMIAQAEYGKPFASVVRKKNIFGAQFHPEKSHRFGATFLKNFAELAC